MLKRRPSRYLVPLIVLCVSLFAAGLVACDGDTSSPDRASPSPRASATEEGSPQQQGSPQQRESPTATAPPQGSPLPSITPPAPNTGPDAIEILASYLAEEGVDGQKLDSDESADCSEPAGPGTPIEESRLTLGQFCVSVREQDAERIVFLVEVPDGSEQWEVELRFQDTKWQVVDAQKVTG